MEKPNPGALESWRNEQIQKGNLEAAEAAKALIEQYGDIALPQTLVSRRLGLLRQAQRNFILEAVQMNLHSDVPFGTSEDRWISTRNILGAVAISDTPITRVAEVYGLAQPNLFHRFRRGLSILYSRAPEELKQKYPAHELHSGGLLVVHTRPAKVIKEKGPGMKLKINTKLPESARTDEKPLHPRLQEVLLSQEKIGRYNFAPPKTREFLLQVIRSGAQLIKPDDWKDDLWLRRRNVMGIYFSTHSTLDNLAQIYGVSRELIRLDIKNIISTLWNNLPTDIQQLFPLSEIPLVKSVFDYAPEYRLLVSNGTGNRVLEAIDQGKTGHEVVKLIPLAHAPETVLLLKELGIDIPGRQKSTLEITQIIESLRDKSKTDREIQQLLDTVNSHLYLLNGQEEKGFILPIVILARDLGFHMTLRENHLIEEALRKAKIPVGHMTREVKSGPQKGMMHYWFIAAIHETRAIEVLSNDPTLEQFLKNPVTQLSGERTKLPTTWNLEDREKYPLLADLLIAMSVKRPRKTRIFIKSLFNENCKLTIYQAGGKLQYPVEQTELLKEFILTNLPSNLE